MDTTVYEAEVFKLFLLVFPLMFSPGPTNFLCAASGSRHGVVRSVPMILGMDLMVFLPALRRKCTPWSSECAKVSRSSAERLPAAGRRSGACVSSTALVSASADQNTGCSPAFSDGGTKKLQAPLPVELALQ